MSRVNSAVTACAVAATMLFGGLLPSPAGAAPPSAALKQALTNLVADGVPGAMAAERDGAVTTRAAAGVADLSTKRAMQPNEHFRIGSMTKAFTSTVALQLVAEHRLSLDDSVEKWLPGVVPNGQNITIRELMNHTSGIADYADIPFYVGILQHPLESWTPEQLVARAVAQPPLFPPGTNWSYSNTNYILLGMIVARADHVPAALEMVDPALEMAARIFGPLRLRDTSFSIFSPRMKSPFTHGYTIGAPPEWDVPPVLDTTFENMSWGWTAGAIVSTLDDMMRFHRALFTGELLPPAQQTDLQTTVDIAPGVGYGLGVFRLDLPCGTAWGHDGGTPSSVSISLTSPDGTRQAAMMVNSDANTWSAQTAQDFAVAYVTAFCGSAPTPAAARRLGASTARDLLSSTGVVVH